MIKKKEKSYTETQIGQMLIVGVAGIIVVYSFLLAFCSLLVTIINTEAYSLVLHGMTNGNEILLVMTVLALMAMIVIVPMKLTSIVINKIFKGWFNE